MFSSTTKDVSKVDLYKIFGDFDKKRKRLSLPSLTTAIKQLVEDMAEEFAVEETLNSLKCDTMDDVITLAKNNPEEYSKRMSEIRESENYLAVQERMEASLTILFLLESFTENGVFPEIKDDAPEEELDEESNRCKKPKLVSKDGSSE